MEAVTLPAKEMVSVVARAAARSLGRRWAEPTTGLETSKKSRSAIRAHFDEAYNAYVKEDANREDTLYQPPCKLSGGVNLSPGFATSLIVAIGMMAAKMTAAVLTE